MGKLRNLDMLATLARNKLDRGLLKELPCSFAKAQAAEAPANAANQNDGRRGPRKEAKIPEGSLRNMKELRGLFTRSWCASSRTLSFV